MILCNIEFGRNGNEWIAVITYAAGRVEVFRNTRLDEVILAVTKELEELE